MTRRPADWLSVAEARERILAAVLPMPVVQAPLEQSDGAVLARDIVSPVDLPPWDNSAMDGFAVRADDVRGASPDSPVQLTVIEDIPAGQRPRRALQQGEAARVMTGAPVPEGADGVIRIEHTDVWQGAEPRAGAGTEPPYTIRVLHDEDADRNIRPRGEDLGRGDTVLHAGRLIGPAEAGILAAAGHDAVDVYERPELAIVSTGDELVTPERIDDVRRGMGIVDSNSYALAAAARAAGARARRLGIARDDVADLREHLERALDADALATTAGASVGDRDLVKDVLQDLGFQLRFWRVTMKPGSPFSFGVIPRRERPPLPVFGLPGNPVSALVTFEVLVRPALRRMMGRSEVHTPTLSVRLAEDFPSRTRLMHFMRARLERQGDAWLARLTGPQGSGILRSMALADALVIVPESADVLKAGSEARAIPLRTADAAVAEPGF